VTRRTGSSVRHDPGNAVALAVALLAFLFIEVVYLESLWKRNEESRKANEQQEANNSQMRRHNAELRAAAEKISATFTRLNDGIIRLTNIDGRLPIPGRGPKGNLEYGDSKVAKSLQEFGLVVKSLHDGRRETSASFEAGSNHLELHRLIPFLAEQENSNAFLFIDKLDLVRPLETPAFSMHPTELQTRLLFRVLSGPK
jgi:hypothetical protein